MSPARNIQETTSRLRLVFIAMAIVVLVGTTISFIAGLTAMSLREKVQRFDSNVEQLDRTLLAVQQCESGQRGYLLTHEERYLEPYFTALAGIRKQVDSLRSLAEEGQISRKTVDEITRLIEEKQVEMSTTIELDQTGRRAESVEVIRSGLGRDIMSDLREAITEARSVQQRERADAEHTAATSLFYRALTFIFVAILILAFLAWAFARIRREMTRQYVAALETQRQKDILSVTLASIGDAVIITDTLGKITFINDVACRLTGWDRHEAYEQPCEQVFRVISETAREQRENPVHRILRDGVTVGLANNSLLIRRDGSELPIDDSGAPIREADGTVRGVVLVFRDFTAHKEASTLR